MKHLNMSLDINAMGCSSGAGYSIPVSDFENGKTIPVTTLLPDLYADYVAPIFARLNDDKTAIEIISEKYGNGLLPLNNRFARWDSPEIGLSYACCKISISIIEKNNQ